jgi:hypothetical protein
MVEGKTGGGLLGRLQMRNWAVIRINFIGFDILADEEVDQLLGIVRASCINTSADLIGTTLVRGTKLSSSVIHFLRGTLVLFTQWGQWITVNKLKNKITFSD